MRRGLLLVTAVMTAACTTVAGNSPSANFDADASHQFFANLQSLCGGTYPGRVISDDAVDADWRASELVLGPVDCAGDRMSLPLRVGDDTSRTWFLKRNPYGLAFHHQHLEPDGTPSDVSMYGGAITQAGTPTRQAFPADAGSKIMFEANDLGVSVDNVWTLTLQPGESLTYALSRPERDFRALFDLTP